MVFSCQKRQFEHPLCCGEINHEVENFANEFFEDFLKISTPVSMRTGLITSSVMEIEWTFSTILIYANQQSFHNRSKF